MYPYQDSHQESRARACSGRCAIAILKIVDQLADLLEQGKTIPLTPYRVIDGEEFGQLLERMRINVPSSIRESERTLAERDNILAEAEEEAAQILEEARQRARELLSGDSMVIAARQEADRILEESRLLAKRRPDEADEYATNVLQDLAEKLRIISQQVDNGIRMLQSDENEARRPLAAPADSDE